MKVRAYTPAAAPAETRAFPTTDEQMAAQDKAANSTEGLAGTVGAAAEGAISMVPGAQWAQAKLMQLAGIPEQYTAKLQDQLDDEHPLASFFGKGAGAALLGKMLPGTAAYENASTLKKMGISALQNAILEPFAKIGNIAQEAQTHNDALHVEQIMHAISPEEMLEAAAIGAAGPLAGRGLGKAIEKAPQKVAGLAKATVRGAGASVGHAIGGLPGAVGGYEGANLLIDKSSPLVKKFAEKWLKASPEFETKLKDTMGALFGAATVGGAEVVARANQDFDELQNKLHRSMDDPDGTASKIRAHLDSLPPDIADAVTANTMDKLQHAAVDLPQNKGPATAFGQMPALSDRQKAEYMRRTRARFDPFYAVQTGRQDLIRESERHNPETINVIKNRVVEHIADNPDLPYMKKRSVLGILGVAGTPTQDPALAAQLQDILAAKKKAADASGQMESARQSKAELKNDQATLTRAQKLMENGE